MLQSSQLPHAPFVVPPGEAGIRTLLLDDNTFDRQRIRRMSSKTDLCIEIDEVGSIAQLSTAVSRAPYDLILIDYRLPVGDGMQALSHVSQNALNKHAAKIMITGDGATDTIVRAMRSGCHDFLSKDDMTADLLRTAMLNALAAARQQQDMTEQARLTHDAVREGLISALQDKEVQGNVISLMRHHLAVQDATLGKAVLNTEDVEGLLAAYADGDEFVFH